MKKVYISFLGGDAIPYVTHDLLVVGDYGGAGSVGAANIAFLLEQFGSCAGEWAVSDGDSYRDTNGVYPSLEVSTAQEPLVVRKGVYGYAQAYVLESAWLEKGYELEDYAILDDDTLSRTEEEWIEAAWDDYGKRELQSSLESLELGVSNEVLDTYKSSSNIDSVAVFEYCSAYLDRKKVLENFLEWQTKEEEAKKVAAYEALLLDQGVML